MKYLFKESNPPKRCDSFLSSIGSSQLDLSVLLKPHRKGFLLDYTIKFSSPSSHSSGTFSGNREIGKAKIFLNKPLKLFEIGLKSKSKENNYFPWLKNIPLLGHFFENTTSINHYKKISAIILLKRLEEQSINKRKVL